MREIVSPLSGIRSPFGQPVDPYKVAGRRPPLVLDFDAERYRADGGGTTFSSAITHAATTNATMVGSRKWSLHNLFPNSTDLSAWATQTNVSVSGVTATFSTTNSSIADSVSYPTGSITSKVKVSSSNHDWVRFITAGVSTWFDLSSVSVGTSNHDTASIVADGDGYLLTVTDETTAGVNEFALTAASADGSTTEIDGAILTIEEPRVYRSDLGGMVNNPDTGTDYVPNSTSSPLYLPRRGHHTWDGSAWVNNGLLHESEARTNLVDNSQDPENATKFVESSMTVTYGTDDPAGGTTGVTQSAMADAADTFRLLNTTAVAVNDIYTGSMWIKMAAGETCIIAVARNGAGTFEGTTKQVTGTGQWVRESVSHTFANVQTGSRVEIYYGGTNAATSVEWAWPQIEKVTAANPFPSSYIPTYGATATRAAETLTIPAANLPWPEPNVLATIVDDPLDSAVGWTLDAAWSISGGVLSGVATGGVVEEAFRAVSIEDGKVYSVSFDVSGATNLEPSDFIFNLGTEIPDTAITENGSYEYYFVSAATATRVLKFRFGAPAEASDAVNIDNVSVREIDPLAVSIAMEGKVSYEDDDTPVQFFFYRWEVDSNNKIVSYLNTGSAATGRINVQQVFDGVFDTVAVPTGNPLELTPGSAVPFSFAARHGSTFINGAVDGTALTEDTTPVGLVDLSSSSFLLASNFTGTISSLRIWDDDIGSTGISEASA